MARKKPLIRLSVLCAICKDRPGLLHELAQFIKKNGGNIIESYAHVPGPGEKSILIVSVVADEQHMQKMQDAQMSFQENTGISLLDNPTVRVLYEKVGVEVEIVGRDFPGLLEDLTALIAEHGYTILQHNGREIRQTGPPYDYRMYFRLASKNPNSESLDPRLRWHKFHKDLGAYCSDDIHDVRLLACRLITLD